MFPCLNTYFENVFSRIVKCTDNENYCLCLFAERETKMLTGFQVNYFVLKPNESYPKDQFCTQVEKDVSFLR